MTVEEWMNQWLDSYVKKLRKPKTFACYSDTVRRILVNWPDLAQWPLDRATELDIQQFINAMANKYAKSTLNDMRVVLHRCYAAAIRNHLCCENPAVTITLPIDATQKEISALSFDEQFRLEKAARQDVLGHLVLFFLYTGLRAHELMALRWKDYNPEQQEIAIQNSKTKAGQRVVPLIPLTERIIKKQPRINQFIFNSTIGNPITPTVLKKLYARMREATGIATITTHVYRHCFATRLVENGVDYKALSKLLGHTDIAFTLQQYVNAETDFLHKQIHLLTKNPIRILDQNQVTYPDFSSIIISELRQLNERFDELLDDPAKVIRSRREALSKNA